MKSNDIMDTAASYRVMNRNYHPKPMRSQSKSMARVMERRNTAGGGMSDRPSPSPREKPRGRRLSMSILPSKPSSEIDHNHNSDVGAGGFYNGNPDMNNKDNRRHSMSMRHTFLRRGSESLVQRRRSDDAQQKLQQQEKRLDGLFDSFRRLSLDQNTIDFGDEIAPSNNHQRSASVGSSGGGAVSYYHEIFQKMKQDNPNSSLGALQQKTMTRIAELRAAKELVDARELEEKQRLEEEERLRKQNLAQKYANKLLRGVIKNRELQQQQQQQQQELQQQSSLDSSSFSYTQRPSFVQHASFSQRPSFVKQSSLTQYPSLQHENSKPMLQRQKSEVFYSEASDHHYPQKQNNPDHYHNNDIDNVNIATHIIPTAQRPSVTKKLLSHRRVSVDSCTLTQSSQTSNTMILNGDEVEFNLAPRRSVGNIAGDASTEGDSSVGFLNSTTDGESSVGFLSVTSKSTLGLSVIEGEARSAAGNNELGQTEHTEHTERSELSGLSIRVKGRTRVSMSTSQEHDRSDSSGGRSAEDAMEEALMQSERLERSGRPGISETEFFLIQETNLTLELRAKSDNMSFNDDSSSKFSYVSDDELIVGFARRYDDNDDEDGLIVGFNPRKRERSANSKDKDVQ
mmetsp:Transcript_29346/g.61878  ORF Transcript_29346/g.61878 Transcript_29346/m.61878 type:complete len:626 (-) Transcript_29346:670-2547(-)